MSPTRLGSSESQGDASGAFDNYMTRLVTQVSLRSPFK